MSFPALDLPPADLLLAVAVQAGVAALGVAVGVGSARLCRRGRRARELPLALAALAGGALALWLIAGREPTFAAGLLPVPAVIVYGNPAPLLGGVLAGLLATQRSVPAWRRLPLAAAVAAVGLFGPASTLLHEPPPVRPQRSAGVDLQTHPATCSAAAAATLLRARGVGGYTEKEMARLCLTGERGTPLLGVYRGLYLAAEASGSPLRPVFHRLTVDRLRARPELLPAVVSVRLTDELDAREPRYRREWGWLLGVTHSVVLFRFTGSGRVEVGDPGAGREMWSVEGLEELWVGDVLSLVDPGDPVGGN